MTGPGAVHVAVRFHSKKFVLCESEHEPTVAVAAMFQSRVPHACARLAFIDSEARPDKESISQKKRRLQIEGLIFRGREKVVCIGIPMMHISLMHAVVLFRRTRHLGRLR